MSAPERRASSRAAGIVLPALLMLLCATLLHAQIFRRAISPHATRALLISIDGLRPDVLLRARTPYLRERMAAGSFTMWARTTQVAITLPSHASMLTGVPPAVHHIVWNDDIPVPIYPARPTLLELAKQAGRTTAMAVAKSKLSVLARPHTLDLALIPPAGTTYPDSLVADTVARWIAGRAPEVMFVHLAAVDLTGHAKGWGSPSQIAAVELDDRCIGRILEALRARGLLESTVVLISADHGGAGRTHGGIDPRSASIPWILSGPGIRQNLDLTSIPVDVRTEDSFATLCDLLGLAIPGVIDGHPVRQAYESQLPAAR